MLLVGGILNPFLWWLSFMEGVEGLVWMTGGVEYTAGIIASILSMEPEGLVVLIGWLGTIGWAAVGLAFIREYRDGGGKRAAAGFIANLLFYPVLALPAVLIYHRSHED